MVIVARHITVEPDQRRSYLADWVEIVERARGAAECLDCAIDADQIDGGRINIFELWQSQAALDAYRGSGPSDAQTATIVSGSVALRVDDARRLFDKGLSGVSDDRDEQ